MDIVTSDCSDYEKAEALGLFKTRAQTDEPDIFSGFFNDTTIDIQTGALLGRYICEERDTGRMIAACSAKLKAKHEGADGACGPTGSPRSSRSSTRCATRSPSCPPWSPAAPHANGKTSEDQDPRRLVIGVRAARRGSGRGTASAAACPTTSSAGCPGATSTTSTGGMPTASLTRDGDTVAHGVGVLGAHLGHDHDRLAPAPTLRAEHDDVADAYAVDRGRGASTSSGKTLRPPTMIMSFSAAAHDQLVVGEVAEVAGAQPAVGERRGRWPAGCGSSRASPTGPGAGARRPRAPAAVAASRRRRCAARSRAGPGRAR